MPMLPASPRFSATADPGGRRTPPPGGRRARAWRCLPWVVAGVVAVVAAGSAALVAMVWNDTPDAASVQTRIGGEPSRIVSSDGVILQVLEDRAQEPVTPAQVAPALRDALLATEDRRFFDHAGIDWRRIVGSAIATLRGDVQGGSTLTQQLARNLFPQEIGNRRSLMRKLREIVVALKLERHYDKQQILGLYLNQVPYLYNVSGVGAASRTYFGKPVSALAPHEAALLVAMLKGPAQYDPDRFPARALARRNLVLAQMVQTGRLDAATAGAEAARPLGVALQRSDTAIPPAPHYLRLVRQQLGDWAKAHGLHPQRDGLQVQVSLDTRQQALAEQAVARQTALLQAVAASEWSRAKLRAGPPPARGSAAPAFAHFWQARGDLLSELLRATPAYRRAIAQGAAEADALQAGRQDPQLADLQADRTRLEAGFVVLDPTTGAVRAHVGSRDFAQDRFDHVTQARRQPGSTFKPFVYGAALVGGMAPERAFVDTVVHYTTADGQDWAPSDAGGATGALMSLRSGLARSRNTITAQVMDEVGPSRVAGFAQALGVDRSPLQAVPSLALGTSPVTLLEMVRAYGTLAALGERRAPVFIERIADRDGRVLFEADGRVERVLDPQPAALLVDMLREAVDKGTGTQLRSVFKVRGDIAGKTGTTQNNTDGWFIAMHPRLVVGAWVGFNDQRVTMRSTEWGQGGRSALRLAGDFLAALQKANLMPLDARFPAVQRAPEPDWQLSDDGLLMDDSVQGPRPDEPQREAPPALATLQDGAPERLTALPPQGGRPPPNGQVVWHTQEQRQVLTVVADEPVGQPIPASDAALQ